MAVTVAQKAAASALNNSIADLRLAKTLWSNGTGNEAQDGIEETTIRCFQMALRIARV